MRSLFGIPTSSLLELDAMKEENEEILEEYISHQIKQQHDYIFDVVHHASNSVPSHHVIVI